MVASPVEYVKHLVKVLIVLRLLTASHDANRLQNFFIASSKHLLTKDDSKGSMYFGVSPSGRLLGSTMNGSSTSLNFGRQGSGSTVTSNSSTDQAPGEIADSPFNEEEYINWRTQVKEDYLAWLNAKVEARKRRKTRTKKGDPSKKPRWLLLYEASKTRRRSTGRTGRSNLLLISLGFEYT